MDKDDLKTEEKILEAAKEVFLKKGFDGARMQEIADTAGINKALLHYYFRSKEKLFLKILQEKIQKILPQLGHIAIQDEPLPDKIDRFIDVYMATLIQNQQLPIFILNSFHKNPELVKEIPFGIVPTLEAIFDQAASKGEIKQIDVRQFVLSIVSMCVFPLAAKPMVCHQLELNEECFTRLIEERAKHIKAYSRFILKPE